MFVRNLGLTSPVSLISGNSPWSQKSKGENPTVPGSASRLSPGPNASHRFLSRLTSPRLCGGRTVGLHVDRQGTRMSVGRASAARCRCPPPHLHGWAAPPVKPSDVFEGLLGPPRRDSGSLRGVLFALIPAPGNSRLAPRSIQASLNGFNG